MNAVVLILWVPADQLPNSTKSAGIPKTESERFGKIFKSVAEPGLFHSLEAQSKALSED